jgi:Protein of unknown function (DUF2911)
MRIRIAALAVLLAPAPMAAQIRASEVGTMSQVIDGTTIRMEYSRPRARGRSTLFGTKAVQWGETWTPGANWATTFAIDKDVSLNGHAIPKGKYSVWMVPRETGDWTFVLDPNAHRYHEEHPESSAVQIRFPVKRDTAPFTEVLTWSMPSIRVNGGTLAMDWERAHVALDVAVEPSYDTALPAADAAAYLGEFTYTELDSAGKVTGKPVPFTITHENGVLKGRWTPDDPYMKKFALIRIAPDWFTPGLYDGDGQIYEVLKPDLIFEFTRENGRVVSFLMRDMEDVIAGKGVRRP